jgi:Cu+-exporting ATPase
MTLDPTTATSRQGPLDAEPAAGPDSHRGPTPTPAPVPAPDEGAVPGPRLTSSEELPVGAGSGPAPTLHLARRWDWGWAAWGWEWPRGADLAVVACGVVAAAALGFWLTVGAGLGVASATAFAVLVLAVPATLVRAVPVVPWAQRRGAELGVRLPGPGDDAAARVDTVVVRRRGVLTTGQPWLIDVAVDPAGPAGPDRAEDGADHVLRVVASLARGVDHPVARAVLDAARDRQLPLLPVEVLAARPGLGVRGVVEGRIVVAGRERFVSGWARRVPERLVVARSAAEAAGQTALLVGWEGAVRGVLVLGDPPRPTAAAAVEALAALDVRTLVASGETKLAATATGDAVGAAGVVTHVLPEATGALVGRLRGEGHAVAVTDPGHGPADLVVAAAAPARTDLWTAVDTLRLRRLADRIARENVVLAVAPPAVAVPFAALGVLPPVGAVLVAVVVTAAVVGNGLRARRHPSARPAAHRRP